MQSVLELFDNHFSDAKAASEILQNPVGAVMETSSENYGPPRPKEKDTYIKAKE